MTIQLKPGDYVSTAGMTEEQYHAVAQAFMDAGADKGEYPSFHWVETYDCLGWSSFRGGVWHQLKERGYFTGRQLTLDQILGTTEPAWSGEGLPPVGANCLMQSHILGMWANEWLEVEVLAHKPPLMIGWCEEKQIAIWSDACRPIRTEEDKAIDHMKSVAGTSYVKPEYMEMITRAIYNAGYRKTGEAK